MSVVARLRLSRGEPRARLVLPAGAAATPGQRVMAEADSGDVACGVVVLDASGLVVALEAALDADARRVVVRARVGSVGSAQGPIARSAELDEEQVDQGLELVS